MTNGQDIRIAEPVAEEAGAARDITELLGRLAARLPAPGRITDINLHCGGGTNVLCLIEIADIQAGDAARALGGVPFAFRSVVLEFTPGLEFSCRAGQPASFRGNSCTCSTGQTVSITQIDL